MEQIVLLNEELGEIFCDKCNGTGTYPSGMYQLRCPKCQGKKKLDWCEQIVGVTPKEMSYLSFQTYINDVYNAATTIHPYQEKIMEEMSLSLAKKIDQEILDTLTSDLEHNINDKKE